MSTNKPALPEPDCGLGVHRNTYSSDLMRSYAEECVRAALAAQAEALAKMLQDCADAGDALASVEQENDALRAEVESLRADAERMRWIAAHCKSTAEHWGGRWSIVVEGPAPKRNDEEDAFYAAIDAARAAKWQG